MKQQGVVLVIVLWFLAVVTVMIATLATETRLAAIAVSHNKAGLENWSHTMTAFQLAQMEILMMNMAAHPDDKERQAFLKDNIPWQNRLDGRPLTLAYNDEEYEEIPDEYRLPKGTVVRIYDHSGKINLTNLQANEFRELLKQRIGEDDERLESLIDAWRDWIDSDDLERMNGAEKAYYEELDPPYAPRNNNLETVQELLLIKGFNEVYTVEELEAAFTIYGTHRKLNPNLATREALNMLPGSGGLTEQILISRRLEPIRNPSAQLNEFAQPEQLAEFLPWIAFDTGYYYTIIVQHNQILPMLNENDEIVLQLAGASPDDEVEALAQQNETEDNAQQTTTTTDTTTEQAYSVLVQIRGTSLLPKVIQVNAYGFVPAHDYETAILQYEIENKERMSN